MSVISMMEINSKGPFFWDWENLVMINAKAVDALKKPQVMGCGIDGIEGYEVGSFYSSGGQSDGGSGSDFGYASSSKSSKSASDDSSTDKEMKSTIFTLETTRTSSTIESSAASGESLIALELGKRTYFEDASPTSNSKNPVQTPLPPSTPAKKSKSSALNAEVPRCQVEGCNLNLSAAKDYHRKHRVCESHAKSPKVTIKGVERRFCQQCSRFHGLSEFDQRKRSCRRRLSDHNARRRKPKPEVIQFNSIRMASSLYEDRNQLSFSFSQVPVVQTRQGAWDSPSNLKVMQGKPGFYTAMKSGSDQLRSAQNGRLQSPGIKRSPVSSQLLPSSSTSSGLFQQGVPVSVAQSNLDAAQDLRALSLLSTSSWSSCDPDSSSLEHSMHISNVSLAQSLPPVHAIPLGGGHVSSEYWHGDQLVSSGGGSHTSTFQLFKAPNEGSFYL